MPYPSISLWVCRWQSVFRSVPVPVLIFSPTSVPACFVTLRYSPEGCFSCSFVQSHWFKKVVRVRNWRWKIEPMDLISHVPVEVEPQSHEPAPHPQSQFNCIMCQYTHIDQIIHLSMNNQGFFWPPPAFPITVKLPIGYFFVLCWNFRMLYWIVLSSCCKI